MGVKAAHISAGDGEEAVLEVAPSSGDEEDEKIKKEVYVCVCVCVGVCVW